MHLDMSMLTLKLCCLISIGNRIFDRIHAERLLKMINNNFYYTRKMSNCGYKIYANTTC